MLLNWNLLKNPLNWLVIILMLVIAGMAGHYLLALVNINPATSNDSE